MSKIIEKIKRFWYFRIANPVLREGEAGGFKWSFRKFWLDIRTVSGNFQCRFTAAEHPYGYLLAGEDDDNVLGFCQMLYYLGMVITTDQGLVNDIQKAFSKYEKRLEKVEADPNDSEEAAIAEVKGIQEYVEATPKERRKMERDVNGRFKKAVKDVEKKRT
ncbi:MAG: hypothetical protein J6T35_02430 [Bacteroidales bacterium]|nr:hypothetical protein [Bacteroidales bacterium]